jgi:8-oxo-dGTP pyrophosphatase MutT (NUDIX family)
MSPPHRPIEPHIPKEGDNVRESAVLILIWLNGDQISTVFILRPEYEGIHSNQIAFPGGKFEKSDIDFVATALREANEEVGIIPESITILGQLSPLYIYPSQFYVYPVVGYTTTTPSFIPDPVEIKKVITCNLFSFLNSDSLTFQDIEVGQRILPEIPCYKIEDKYMWGATAMIFSELLEIIKTIE